MIQESITESQYNIISYGNSVSCNFFDYDKKCFGGGSTYLISRAITETPVLVSHVIHPQEICYHMMIGNFVNNLTRSQRNDFAQIISHTAELASIPKCDSPKFLQPSLPTSALFIDGVYMRGKFALLPNVPHPTVRVIDNHGYVSILDCVATMDSPQLLWRPHLYKILLLR
jgi:hypothetical protein